MHGLRQLKRWATPLGGAASIVLLMMLCLSDGAPRRLESAKTDGQSGSTAQANESMLRPFTYPTDPCSLVAPEQLANQGPAPITTSPMPGDDNNIQMCFYNDAARSTVLGVTLFRNSDRAEHYRLFKLRTITVDGVEVLVMADESDRCSIGLVGPYGNIVTLDFTPSRAAAKAAAVPGQTWCDVSAPVAADVAKKLGWAGS